MSYPDEITPVEQDIRDERDRQDRKWGVQNHGLRTWAVVLMEEVGEFSEAVLQGRITDAKAEMVQIAAVAVATLECMDRNGWQGTGPQLDGSALVAGDPLEREV